MDYVFRDYLGSDEGLYVYYFDNTTQQFVEVAANISVGNDDYLEFTIDHNSEFVITAGEIKVNETNPPVNPDDDNEDIQPPVIEDDTTNHPPRPAALPLTVLPRPTMRIETSVHHLLPEKMSQQPITGISSKRILKMQSNPLSQPHLRFSLVLTRCFRQCIKGNARP